MTIAQTQCPVAQKTDEKPRLLVSLLIRFQLPPDRENSFNATPLVSLDNLVTSIRQSIRSIAVTARVTWKGVSVRVGDA